MIGVKKRKEVVFQANFVIYPIILSINGFLIFASFFNFKSTFFIDDTDNLRLIIYDTPIYACTSAFLCRSDYLRRAVSPTLRPHTSNFDLS